MSRDTRRNNDVVVGQVVEDTQPMFYFQHPDQISPLINSYQLSQELQAPPVDPASAIDSSLNQQYGERCPLCRASNNVPQVKGRVKVCTVCGRNFCMMCEKESKQRVGCGFTDGYCDLFYGLRFFDDKRGPRVRRGDCRYWTTAVAVVILYPVWGLFYWLGMAF